MRPTQIELWELSGWTTNSKKSTAVFNFPDCSRGKWQWVNDKVSSVVSYQAQG